MCQNQGVLGDGVLGHVPKAMISWDMCQKLWCLETCVKCQSSDQPTQAGSEL